MMATYELYLSDDRGSRLLSLDISGGFSYTRVCNAIGAFVLTLPESFDTSYLKVDRRVEFWRGAEGVRLGLDFLGFIRGWTFATNAQGQTVITVRGTDANDLLRRRIVAYAAGASESVMSDYADDMLKAVVDDNLESDAPAGRDLVALGFTRQPDLGNGPAMDRAFAYRNVLTVCQEIVSAAWGLGTEVFFDIVPTTPTTLQFQTWTGQRGLDHTYPDGVNPVIFGLEFGNLESPALTYDYSQEVTYVYGLGQGDGADRVTAEVEDTARSGMSAWNRCEAAQDARSETSSAAVEDAAYKRLAEGRPVVRFTGKLRDTEGVKYGREWGFGDKITCTYRGQQFNAIVRAVTVTVDGSGAETLDARAEVVA